MADEKKRRLYGGSYDDQINDTYSQITNRPAFNYDVDGDALYQQYKDRYTQNAKMSMKDTMGQAAALTGGYGNSYGQAVGQQAYDRTMLGLTDMIPTLEQNAYQKWQDQGNALQNRFSMLNTMGATEQATDQADYAKLAQLISSSGYQPTADDLTRAGMNAQQANALRQMWIASNPGAAYINGQLSASDYFKLTGQYPPDVAAAQAAGGGGVGSTVPNGSAKELALYYASLGAPLTDINKALATGGYSNKEVQEASQAARTAIYGSQRTSDPNAPDYRKDSTGKTNTTISANAVGLINPWKRH